MGEDSDTGRIIVFVIIAIIYGVSAIVKKVRQWAEENKARQQQMQPPEEVANRMPQVPREQPRDLPREMPGGLLEELKRKLRDFQEASSRPETPKPQPYQQPPLQPQKPAIRATTRSYAAARPPRPIMPAMPHKSAASAREAAVVRHRRLGHLAVLRNPADIQRGVVLNEILSPPLAMRRGLIPTFRRI